MARDRADHFSFSELAVAGGISRSNYQVLDASGELPGGRGIRDFKRVAAIGAFMKGGMPLLVAARLVAGLLESAFGNYGDGEVPTCLKFMVREVPGAMAGLPFGDYWYHLAIRDSREKAGLSPTIGATKSDAIIDIVDGNCVFQRTEYFPKPNFLGVIEGWGTGSHPQLLHPGAGTIEIGQDEAVALHKNAISILSVNVSLAVRQALDRLAEHRAHRYQRHKKAA